MARTARGETAWITRGEMAWTARGETASDRRGNGATATAVRPRPPGYDYDCGPVGFRSRVGVNYLGVSLGGQKGHGAIFVVNY